MSENGSSKKIALPPRFPARWILVAFSIVLLTQVTVWASDNDILPKFAAFSNDRPATNHPAWPRPLVLLDVGVEPGSGASKSSERISSAVRLETPVPVSISVWPGLAGEVVWPGWSPPSPEPTPVDKVLPISPLGVDGTDTRAEQSVD